MADTRITDVRRSDRGGTAMLAVLFGLIATLTGTDLALDAGEGASTGHMIAEGLAMIIGLVGLAVMVRQLVATQRAARQWRDRSASLTGALEDEAARAAELEAHLAATREDAHRWRTEARTLLDGLGAAIDRQFDRWGATHAEKEVGLLLLKGLTHKDIAEVRGTSDATARQQARALYQKAGLSGRNDLSAFFLEDLLLPIAAPTNDDRR